MPQPLGSKDAASFKSLVKLYEAKQHKKAIKIADGILKKNPNHGETLAMKGHTTEAFDLARIALKADMKSHMCWHVYGLLYRSTKQLDEAIKAYKFALKLEPESAQIQRDLAFLQVQMRDYEGYIVSRKAMLQAKPQLRQNWTALAVAYHLAGNLEAAEHHLKTYEETLKTPPPRTDVENSDTALYRNDLLAEMGQTERALEHLESIYKTSLDRTAVLEARAKYQLKLGQKEEAEKSYRALVVRNNEFRPYYEALEKTLGLDRSNPEDTEKLIKVYEEFAEANHRLDAARRIPLDFLEGEHFKTHVDRYLKYMLSKGIPSAFANIKAHYSEPFKLRTSGELVESDSAESDEKKDEEEAKQTNGNKKNKFEEARLYFLAQHYDYFQSRNLEKAMENIEAVLKLNPKSVEAYMTKARIWKHYGNTEKAMETMALGRDLEPSDRYINTKYAKYQLRHDDNEAALKTMSKFTRNETVGGALGDLHDMQCMWYITEDGESNLRQEKLSVALKRFNAIYNIFEVWEEDQFDFHQFSFRKGQIRAYIDMMRWEDKLREHPFFARAAMSAIDIYIRLHDTPDLSHGTLANGSGDLASMNAVDKKKAIKKAKKEQERIAEEEAKKREAEKKATPGKKGTGADGEPKKEDPDPQGITLLETKTPLEDAAKFLQPLLEFAPKVIEHQNWGFEVQLRRKKYLLALKCLIAAHSLDPEQSKLHEQLIRFRQTLDAAPKSESAKLNEVFEKCSKIIPVTSSLTSFNEEYLKKHATCARRTQSGLQGRQLLDPSSQSKNEKALVESLDFADLEEAFEGLKVLKLWKSDANVKGEYMEKAAKKWPEASVFKKT
ncbi:hypothetical protein BLS_008089 [Venturia inaequalis]|uniref:Uncharacterized protein n=1 Tax=Venturia inaequalis TaxID=5025 RepID=A0A8H3V5T7_VENIN|nr:hypothetical protein BLS_008089 [Venturia inaequalis]